MKEFKDKVAVVTGASSGMGRAFAEHCAAEGMKVVMADIDEKNLLEAEKGIKAKGAVTLVVRTDVSKAEDVESLAKKTLGAAFGAVHLLFNNAGVGAGANIWESTLADWKWILDVNLWGVIYGVHFFVPLMLKQNTECHIINTSSVAGLIGGAGLGLYKVSKHGVVVISECLYGELAQVAPQIGVSVLCPGNVKTRIFDSERNRPANLKNDPAYDQAIASETLARRKIMEPVGLAPEHVADTVFKAISERKFYIFTGPETQLKTMIKARAEDIIQERNPVTSNPAK